jgi:hypothetical protein
VSENLRSQTESFLQRPIVRKLGAVAAAAAVGLGVHVWDNHNSSDQANQALTALGNLYGINPDAITGDLPTIPELRSPNYTVPKAYKDQLKSSTLAVMRRVPSNRYWYTAGTGTKVNYLGDTYILTALHVLGYNYIPPLTTRPADALTAIGSAEYAIANPQLSDSKRVRGNIVGTATGAAFIEPAVLENPPDIALLKIKSSEPHSFQNYHGSLMEFHHITPPKPGTQVFMYDVTREAPEKRAIGADGTYLGRTALPTAEPNLEQVDIIGLKAKESSKDTCENGGSGSSFIASNRYISGPAFDRAGLLSQEKVLFDEHVHQEPETKLRWQIESALNANLKAYPVLCTFTVMAPDYPSQLVRGFGVQEDPYR